MASLLEKYKNRIAVAEKVYEKMNNGEKLVESKKVATAQLLENANRFLTEAYANSVGTQQADMGLWKKFCINLTNVVNPTLIAPDLVMTQPLASMSGYVTYLKFTYGSNKGTTVRGTAFNDPFRLGAVDDKFTSAIVSGETKANATASTKYDGKLGWFPVVKGHVEIVNGTQTLKDFDGDGKLYVVGVAGAKGAEAGTIDYTDGTFSITSTAVVAGAVVANYAYDNVVIPGNDIPTINCEVASIPLMAKARRVQVYYSQIAEFQAKTDYGFDLASQLKDKAAAELAWEIDTEIVKLLDDTAGTANASLTWSKTLPVGVSKRDHYAGFAESVETAKQIIYDRTKRFAPTYMVCASNIIPVLSFIDGFKAASTAKVNGPYKAGTFGGLGVYVSPAMAANRFIVGVNNNELQASVAVYAPYMTIVPTQLLQYADGGTNQGWSTLYALEVLNPDLIVAGEITTTAVPVAFNTADTPIFTSAVE